MAGYLNSWIISQIILFFVAKVSDAKTCYLMDVSGAYFRAEYNGLYDLMSGESCNGRNVYMQRNSSYKHYMFYYKPDNYKYGWVMGPEICEDRGYIYGWNTHKRPDYMLRNWMERAPSYGWVYNTELLVRCTEGLTYGAIVGIIIGCIFGLPVIIIGAVFAVRRIKYGKKVNSSHHRSSRHTGNIVTSSPEAGDSPSHVDSSRQLGDSRVTSSVTNVTFDPDGDLPPYSLHPPQYDIIDRPGAFPDVIPSIPPITPIDITGEFPLTPPTYDVSGEVPLAPPTYDEAISTTPQPTDGCEVDDL